MTVVVLAVATLAFALTARRLDFLQVWKRIGAVLSANLSALGHPHLSDEEKARLARRAARELFILAFLCTGRFVLALAPAACFVFLADLTGLTSAASVLTLSMSWQGILILCLFAAPAFLPRRP